MASSASVRDTVQATDEVIRLLVAGEPRQALCWAAPLAQLDPAHPVHWFLLGCALGKQNHVSQAITALGLAVDRGLATSNLPVAIAACERLRELGADNAGSVERLARSFAKDSKILGARPDAPPSLPGQRSQVSPLPESTKEVEILALVNAAMERASALIDASAVSEQPLFSSLGVKALQALLGAFSVQLICSEDVLIEQGAPGQEAFVLARGELEVVRSTETERVVLARLGNGTLFGEMALLSRTPRAASVVASRPCIVLSATRGDLDALAEKEPELGQALAQFCRQRMLDNLLRTSGILRAVSAQERTSLIEQFETQTHEAETLLIEQGQQSEGLYLIASGEVQVWHREADGEVLIATLGPGEVVGEVALVLRRPATTDVRVSHPSVLLHLPRERFLEVIKHHPQLLAELYEVAVRRDEETSSIVAEQASDADDCILL